MFLLSKYLKSILGGQTDASRSCFCTYHYGSGNTGTETVAADSETVCKEKCDAACSKSGSCISANYRYSADFLTRYLKSCRDALLA